MRKLTGVTTALVTPFYHKKVDFASIEKLVNHQIKGGVRGFVVNGTTAESPTLESAEVEEIFKFIKKIVPKEFHLIVGTGSNSTKKSIEDSIKAEKMGADAALVVVPYYNKPPQRGLAEHFLAIADEVSIPLILYNVPGRTITSLELDTIKSLREHPRIVGIKEASGQIDFAKQIRSSCGPDFLMLSGDDGTYDDFVKAGGDGVISVASHVIPEAMRDVQASRHLDLINLLFCEANPIPVKMALFQMGLIASPECRLPLTTLSPTLTEKLRIQLKQEGFLP